MWFSCGYGLRTREKPVEEGALELTPSDSQRTTSVRYEQQRPGAQQANYACAIAIPSLSLRSPYYSAVGVGRSASRAPNRFSVQGGCSFFQISFYTSRGRAPATSRGATPRNGHAFLVGIV